MTATARFHLSHNAALFLDEEPTANDLFAPDIVQRLSRARGHFALHAEREDGAHVLARDAMGVHKLFFALHGGRVVSSTYLTDLRAAGFAIDTISSVPSGHLVHIQPREGTLRLEKFAHLPWGDAGSLDDDLANHAARIRATLDETFAKLTAHLRGRPLYVTMSGGLDSSAIAALVRAHVGPFTGLTFCVGDAEAASEPGHDLFHAREMAAHLGVPLEVISVPREQLTAHLDDVLLWGQDHRDFNVHCGVVNAAIAAALAGRHDSRPVIVTGDTMNELMADYSAVTYRGRVHYALPRLAVGRLRRFLVTGLDTGDREVGIFARAGIDTVQPYALCADAYTALPERFVEAPAAKQRLVELVLGDRIPRSIYERPKVRAQVGDSQNVGGTLAAFVDAGLDAEALATRFAHLLDITPRELGNLMRAGRYRFFTSFPQEAAHAAR